MAIFTVKGFSGMRPILDPRLIGPNEAQLAKNARLQSGALAPYKSNGTATTLTGVTPANVKKIYAINGGAKWLTWNNEVDVIESPIIDDQWDRLYWSGDGVPKYGPKSYIAGSAPYPSASYNLGIPKPAGVPKASGAAISDNAKQTREYAVTFLNASGSKESAFSATTSTTCLSDHYLYGLYDVTVAVVGTTVTVTYPYAHDHAVNDYIKLASSATHFKITAVPDAKTVQFDRGSVTITAGSTTAQKSVRAKVALSNLPTSANMQSAVTQKRIYRKVNDVWRQITTIPLSTSTFDDDKLDSELTSSTAVTATVLNTPARPSYTPTPSYVVEDTSISDNSKATTPATVYQRVYAVSWVTDGGYESPMSKSSGMIGCVDGVTQVKVTHAEDPPSGVEKKRLYRCDVTVGSGGTFTLTESSYKLVAELPAAQVTYTDIYAQATIASRAAPTNQDALSPPDNFFAAVGTLQPTRSSETRVYVYTYVTAYGEEGPPSDPSDAVDIDAEYPVTVSNLSGAPNGAYNIAKIYLYRTATASSGATDYQLVSDNISIGTGSYVDKIKQVALGEVIPSIGWIAPPTDMQGLRLMANGIGIGWSQSKTICFSEPYMPHAYPDKYKISVDYPVVGIGAFGQSAAIVTKGYPYIVNGVDPASMTLTKLPLEQACVSKRSVVETGSGVIYASPDGLVSLGAGGVNILTIGLLSQAQWQAYNPSSIHGYWHESRYHGFCTVNGTVKMFILDTTGQTTSWCEADISAYAGHRVLQDDSLYVLTSSGLQALFEGSTYLTYTWRSKIAQLPAPGAFSFGQVQASSYPVTLNVTADGVSRSYTVSSAAPFRLQSTGLALEWVVEVVGTAVVNSISLAQSSWELKNV